VSRRGASPSQPSRWVFNRLAPDYLLRPGYPEPLVARLLSLAGGPGARVADLGAGTGLLAVPLARAGARVDAVEPARAMLERLCAAAVGLPVAPVHAPAEESGLDGGAFDLVLLADALQWVDPERAGREVARLLAPGGALAVVTPRLADTPFLRALEERIARANPKARRGAPAVARLCAAAGLPAPARETFADEVRLEPERLDAVLRSLSFVGPALGPAALAALLADARALAEVHGGAGWRREIALEWASARGSPARLTRRGAGAPRASGAPRRGARSAPARGGGARRRRGGRP
jgi:SAM-dependent methyltransferase